MKTKNKSKLLILAALTLVSSSAVSLKSYVFPQENIIVKAKEVSINIDASQTKIEGAGVIIFLSDKPNITVDNLKVTIKSFESTQFENYKDTILSKGIENPEYNPENGRFYGTISNGFPNGSDVKILINVSYELNGDTYSKDLLFEGNKYNPNYGLSALNAPMNAKIINNVLTFDEVSNATGYHIEYRKENKVDKVYEQDVQNGETLNPIIAQGTYYVFIKALGDGETYGDSEYIEVDGTYIAQEIEALPIQIDASLTKIEGAGVEIYFAEMPDISLSDINITILDFESTQFANYKDSIMNNGFNKVDYNPSTGRFFGTIANGFPNDSDVVITFRIMYSYNESLYMQDLVFVSNVYKANYGSLITLDSPTNARVEGNKIFFDEVANASSYHIQYHKESDDSVVFESDITSGSELESRLDAGSYKIYIKAVGDEENYADSIYVEASNIYVVSEIELPTVGEPIAIDEEQTKITGAAVEIYLKDKPNIPSIAIQAKLVYFDSKEGDPNNLLESQFLSKEYNQENGRLFLTLANGYDESLTPKHIIKISYELNGKTYLQELQFVKNQYCTLGFTYAFAEQWKLDESEVRYIGKVYLGDKTLDDLTKKYSKIKFKIETKYNGEDKIVELDTKYVMKSINAGFNEELTAEDGWYFCLVNVKVASGTTISKNAVVTVTIE